MEGLPMKRRRLLQLEPNYTQLEPNYTRIKNLSTRRVDILRMDSTGHYDVLCKKLKHNSSVDIRLFEITNLVAIGSKRKNRMLMNEKIVYKTTTWKKHCFKHYPHLLFDSIPFHSIPPDVTPPLIYVTDPLHSLRYQAILKLASYFKTENEVDLLDLPKELKEDLKLSVRERNLIICEKIIIIMNFN